MPSGERRPENDGQVLCTFTSEGGIGEVSVVTPISVTLELDVCRSTICYRARNRSIIGSGYLANVLWLEFDPVDGLMGGDLMNARCMQTKRTLV